MSKNWAACELGADAAMSLHRLIRSVRRIGRDKRGNVTMTFALSLLPAIGLAGAGVDYSRASRIRTMLQAAADAAAVGSISKASDGYQAALQMSGDGPVPAGNNQAVNIFNGEIKNKTG